MITMCLRSGVSLPRKRGFRSGMHFVIVTIPPMRLVCPRPAKAIGRTPVHLLLVSHESVSQKMPKSNEIPPKEILLLKDEKYHASKTEKKYR